MCVYGAQAGEGRSILSDSIGYYLKKKDLFKDTCQILNHRNK